MGISDIEIFFYKLPIFKIFIFPIIFIRRFFLNYRNKIKNELLDNLGKILTEDPVIKVDEFRGVFTVGSHSDIFRRVVTNNEYELELSKICVSSLNPDRDVIDVGANIGFYTVLFANLLNDRKVLSIEPTPNAFIRLKKNIQLNGILNKVIVFNGVVSDHLGDAEIKTIVGREEYSSMGAMIHPSIVESEYEVIKVPATTIDTLVKENNIDPGFIKIDVEGMEHIVLNGMHNTLKNNKPIILAELSNPLLKRNGSSSEEVIKLIEKYVYRVMDPLSKKLKPGQREYGDILCIPFS